MKHFFSKHLVFKMSYEIREHLIKFFVPIIAVLLLISGVYLVFDQGRFLGAFSMISLELFTPFSFELSSLFGATVGLDIFSVMFILTFINVFAAIFVLWNFDLLLHIPKVGNWLKKFDKKIITLIRKHNLENVGFFSLFLYYLSPLQASGAFTIAILGKLIHLEDKKVIVIVILGTTIGVLIFASPIYGIKALI